MAIVPDRAGVRPGRYTPAVDPHTISKADIADMVMFNVMDRPYNARPGTDCSKAIQKAINDARDLARSNTLPSGAIGSAVVLIPASSVPFYATDLIIYSGVHLIIDAELRAPLGSNKDMIRTSCAYGRFGKGGAGVGEIDHDFTISGKGWLNGNAGFQPGYDAPGPNYNTAGNGLLIWGFDFVISIASISNFKGKGIWTEAGGVGGEIIGPHRPHTLRDTYVSWCGSNGIHFGGPHDGKHQDVWVERCGLNAPGTLAGILIEAIPGISDGNSEWYGCHSWCSDITASHGFAWYVNGGQAKMYGCQADQFRVAGVAGANSASVEWYDGPIYCHPQSSEVPGGTEQYSVAVQLDSTNFAKIRARVYSLGGPMVRFLNNFGHVCGNTQIDISGYDTLPSTEGLYAGIANVDLNNFDIKFNLGGNGSIHYTAIQPPVYRVNYSPDAVGIYNPVTGGPLGYVNGAIGFEWNTGPRSSYMGTHYRSDAIELCNNGRVVDDTHVQLADPTQGAQIFQIHPGFGPRYGTAPATPGGYALITWSSVQVA